MDSKKIQSNWEPSPCLKLKNIRDLIRLVRRKYAVIVNTDTEYFLRADDA